MDIKYTKNIVEVLEKAGITEGVIIDTERIFEETVDGQLIFRYVPIQEVMDFQFENSGIKALIMNAHALEENRVVSIEEIQKRLSANKILLVVYAENPTDKETVFELLSGNRTRFLNIHGYTAAGLRNWMESQGYSLVKEDRIKFENRIENKKDPGEKNLFLESGNCVYKYLSWLETFIQSELEYDFFIQVYEADGNVLKRETEIPFLSIITRTQGKRAESLREVFLTLAGQECMDFEVLVMGHNLGEKETEMVLETIEENPEYMRDKIRYIPVKGGNRSTPINKGFEEAKGEYAVILDDDDFVFDNWVSSFKKKAEECPGAILHAYVMAQDWIRLVSKDGKESLRAAGSPQNQFCRDFNMISELYGNYCPTLGLAFPLYAFRYMGFSFNETLDTTEDWDFLMHISSVCGVADIAEATSIYRLWKNAENSSSLHSQKEWKDNRKKIQKQFESWPLQLPAGYAGQLMKLMEKNPVLFGGKEKGTGQTTQLYYSKGRGFKERDVMITGSAAELPEFRYTYADMESLGELSLIRWDPFDVGNIYVENLRVTITTASGEKIERNISQVDSNGFKSGNVIVFFHPDPQVVINLKKKIAISKIVITGRLHKEISTEMHNHIVMQYDRNLVHKTKKVIKHVGKKVLRR